MTTIVADFEGKRMVSDTKCSYGSTNFQMIKIHEMPDGTLIGFSGSVTEATKFVRWWQAGAKKRSKPVFGDEPFDALVLNAEGISLWDSSLISTKINQPFFAVGSGAEYAIGAMRAGANADQAVAIAVQEDSHSGLPLDVRFYKKTSVKAARTIKSKPSVGKSAEKLAAKGRTR